MTRPAAFVSAPGESPANRPLDRKSSRLVEAVGVVGLMALALITLASPGATRMFAWPWTLAYGLALAAPMLVLVARAFDSYHPLELPAPRWTALAGATVAVVIAAALASPHRGPSVFASAPLLAGLAFFFVTFDWLRGDEARVELLVRGLGISFAIVVLASLALWARDLPSRTAAEVFNARNPYPLGHSNYTAGLALLALPWFVRLGLRASRPASYAWAAAVVLALVMLFTSGSRGGLLGLATLALGALVAAPLDRRRKIFLGVGLALIGLALALANPRTRAMLQPAGPAAEPNVSNLQRSAMLAAGWRMGRDRPFLGWGPGATPLVYPRYRAGLEGGAENVLQLHSAPVELWAELGALGLACALGFAGLVARHARREPTAALALAGYAVFALTDWQLDVPVFSFAVAACAALLAAPATSPTLARSSRIAGVVAILVLGLVALLGHGDPTPEMNTRALALARDPAQADRAIALFNDSLALNPDQEIAHFNLGWLLVVRDPSAAEKHFLAAAHLVPDKGGVYFGLGLARLNQNQPAGAARAFALECLDDPAFLASPWWRVPAIAALREVTAAEFAHLADLAGRYRSPGGPAPRAELARVAALAPQLGRMGDGAVRGFHRERTGYPVLMRNLDLPPPVDLYEVREFATPPIAGLPPKGWLPSPLLLQLLDDTSANPKSKI